MRRATTGFAIATVANGCDYPCVSLTTPVNALCAWAGAGLSRNQAATTTPAVTYLRRIMRTSPEGGVTTVTLPAALPRRAAQQGTLAAAGLAWVSRRDSILAAESL